MIKNTFTSLGIWIAALATAGYACSSSDNRLTGLGLTSGNKNNATGGTTSNGGSTGLGSGGTTSGGTTGTSGDANGTGAGPTVQVDGGLGDGSTTVDEDSACGTGMVSAKLKTVDMLVMYDRSWSMQECIDGTNPNNACADQTATRWAVTSAALKQFFQDTTAAGLNVALRFFPDDKPMVGCDGYTSMFGGMQGGMQGGTFFGGAAGATGTAGSPSTGGAGGPNCDTNACAQVLVPIAPLLADPAPTDAHEAALVAAVDAAAPPVAMPNPNPGTPTSAALGGAVKWATQDLMGRSDVQEVIVLVTDGEPYGCDTSIDNTSAIAGNAYKTSGILTYVIGLEGANAQPLQALNQIAKDGGTTSALFVGATSNASQELLTALLNIKGEALSCDLDIPKSDSSGQTIDPHLVNVNYTSGNGMPSELGYVDNEAACGMTLGWYYDNPTAPTKIHLCPSTCETIKADTSANLQILAGCQPHVVTR